MIPQQLGYDIRRQLGSRFQQNQQKCGLFLPVVLCSKNVMVRGYALNSALGVRASARVALSIYENAFLRHCITTLA
jgi:hypothetical protein